MPITGWCCIVGKDYSSKLEARQLGKCRRGGRTSAAITVVFVQISLHVHSGCLVSPKKQKAGEVVQLLQFYCGQMKGPWTLYWEFCSRSDKYISSLK